MNAESSHSFLLQGMLDGTLDPAGEQAVLDLLSSSQTAREEFARLTQMHAWLLADPASREALSNAASARRRVIPLPCWWLAAAVAAAVILLAASRLWPTTGLDREPGTPPSLVAWRPEPPAYTRPVLQMACTNCHRNIEAFIPVTQAPPGP